MATHLYDSGDPNLPNLPKDIAFSNESDVYSDDEGSVRSHDEVDAEETDAAPVPLHHRETRLFGKGTGQPTTSSAKRRRRRRKKNRKYSDATYSSTAARQRISWEPGVDINSTDVIISSIGSAVTVTDYNKDRYRVEHVEIFTNIQEGSDLDPTSDSGSNGSTAKSQAGKDHGEKVAESVHKLKQVLDKRPVWSKIRWVNVNGLSWEAIATIGEKYNLHRLSIEDMIDIPQRTKTDFYPGHVFGVLPLIKLVREQDSAPNFETSWTRVLKFINLYNYNEHASQDDLNEPGAVSNTSESLTELIPRKHDTRRLNESVYPSKYSRRRGRLLDEQRPLSYRKLFVGVEQCSYFMRGDGIIISFFESSGDDIESAILSRISAGETILRTSCDASILLQSILDAIVDITYPVIAAYRKRLSEFELDILMNPDLKHTQRLHLMGGELAKLRRTILPTSSMINSLRDLAKANTNSDEQAKLSLQKSFPVSGNIVSPLCEVYLADIVDHTMMFTDEIEGMISKVENLIALMFNTISTDTNEAMKRLSLVTIIFLPLSFWTGYYGMNFESFGDLQHNVSYYWKVALPFSIVLMMLISWTFSKRTYENYKRFFKRKISDIRVNRDIKRDRQVQTARRERMRVKTEIANGTMPV